MSLQTHIFPRHSGIHYLGRPFDSDLLHIEEEMVSLDSIIFQQRLGQCQRVMDQILGGKDDRPFVICNESFVNYARYKGHDIGMVMQRLKAVLEGTESGTRKVYISVTIRNQADFVLSYFNEMKRESNKQLDRYIEDALAARPGMVDPIPKVQQDRFIRIFDALFYDYLLDYLSQVFGRQNILLLLFEDLISNPAGYLTSLSEFMGVDPTETIALAKGGHERQRIKSDGGFYPKDHYHAVAYRLATRVRAIKKAIGADEYSISKTAIGRAFWGTSNLIDRIVPARASSRRLSLDEQQRSRIDDLYRESNTRLAATYGIPLVDRGYPVAQEPVGEPASTVT